jgi:hypothetical protein
MTKLVNQQRAVKRSKLKELTSKIKLLLTDETRYRDNDPLLVNRIQRDEMIEKGMDVNTMTLNDFFRVRIERRISSEDSITRLRREVQEYYPETRGINYKGRQSKQGDVQDDLRDIEDEFSSDIVKTQVKAQTLTGAPMITDQCDLCQGSGKYESYPCNVCKGTGEVQFK